MADTSTKHDRAVVSYHDESCMNLNLKCKGHHRVLYHRCPVQHNAIFILDSLLFDVHA